VNGPELEQHIGGALAKRLRDDLELITGVYPAFDREEYLAGRLAPVFFGLRVEQLRCKGVAGLLHRDRPFASSRAGHRAYGRPLRGGVQRLHLQDFTRTWTPITAPAIAFLKVCSGKFERNVNYRHARLDRTMRFSSPTAFMAQKKEILDEAFAGRDIVGLPG